MKHTFLATALLASAGTLGAAGTAAADEVEVLHWWTSGGRGRGPERAQGGPGIKGVTWQDMRWPAGAAPRP